MKKIYPNKYSKEFFKFFFISFLTLVFFIESAQSQSLPFYGKQQTDSLSAIDKDQGKGTSELLTVPEKYKSHPEYGKTKLSNPLLQNSYELIQERTVDSRLFQNIDGTFTVVKSGEPMHYKDADGWWRTIEVAFEEDAVKPQLYLLNKQRLPMTFDGTSGVVSMKLDSVNEMTYGNDLTLMQINNTGSIISKKSINNFSTNVDLNNAKANVSNAFNGIDMSLKFDFFMAKTNYKISSPAIVEPNSKWVIFREKVNIPADWTMEYDASNGEYVDGNWQGDILIKNTSGETMSKFLTPVYFDSGNDKNTNNIKGSYKLEKISNTAYYLYLMVPSAWLSSPDRVYPVTIDPIVLTNDYNAMASCLGSFQSSTINVGIPAGEIIMNTYLLWEFVAQNVGWLAEQTSYVESVGGSTPYFYGAGSYEGTQVYSTSTLIANCTSSGSVNYTFYA